MPANQSTPEVTRAEEAHRLIGKLAAADIDVSGTAAIGITSADIIAANDWLSATPARGGDELREALVLLRDEDADPYSFSGDEDENDRVVSQHRFYRWGDDCVIAIGELNFPNQWDDEAFDAKCDVLNAALASTDMAGAGERSSRKLNDWISAALDGPPVEGLTSGEGEPIGAMLICDRTGGRMFTQWPAPERREQEADSIYGSHGGYRTVPLYAASPKATATASVREGILDRETIARTLFNQRQTTHDFDDAAEADPEGDAGTLYSIVCDDADAVIAALTDTGTAATIGGERA